LAFKIGLMRYPLGQFSPRNLLKLFTSNFVLRRPLPILLSVSVTHRCNARCPFCEFWDSKPINEMTPSQMNKIFVDAYDLGCLGTVLSGGEPLLRKDLPEILEFASDAGLTTSLSTNGYLLKKRIHEIHRHLDVLSVSIDFPDSRHDKTRALKGLFEKAIAGIKLTQQYGISTNINSIITNDLSWKDVEKLLALAESLNCGITFTPMFELPEFSRDGTYIGKLSDAGKEMRVNDWNHIRIVMERLLYYKNDKYKKVIQNSREYLKLVKDRGEFLCHPLCLQVGVSPAGEVGALCSLGLYDCYSLGNALEHSLKDIWYSEKAEQLREKFSKCTLAREAGCYLLCVAELSLIYEKPSMILDYAKRLL
jgi:MoaA/NifB/PqqE/SkfB family radical SAM enzyme